MEEQEQTQNPTEVISPPQIQVTEKEAEIKTKQVLGEEKSPLKRFWYVFAVLGVVLVTSAGVIVYGYPKLSQQAPAVTPMPIATPTPAEEVDQQTAALKTQGTSDEIDDIEADLGATDLSEIDKELEEIESELTP